MSSKKEDGDGEEDNGEGGEGMDVGDHSGRGGGKRKLDTSGSGMADNSDEDGEGHPPPAKRQKPLCKYGPKCYQKNPTHREQFDHPWVSHGYVYHKLISVH